jgi:hypothetical protein
MSFYVSPNVIGIADPIRVSREVRHPYPEATLTFEILIFLHGGTKEALRNIS